MATSENDKIVDLREEAEVEQWISQYSTPGSSMDNTFFDDDDDTEWKDVDGWGAGTIVHDTTGDDLTVLQEYRGFILDGGVGFAGGHKRLSPSRKELLVEVDVMADLHWDRDGDGDVDEQDPVFSADQAVIVMNNVSTGFRDPTNGAGIDLYYVIDEPAATYAIFDGDTACYNWALAHRNNSSSSHTDLEEFIHVMFAELRSDLVSLGQEYSYIYTKRVYDEATTRGTGFGPAIMATVAHEITHSIIDTISANTFDAQEELSNPNPSDGEDGLLDQKYLMYHDTTLENLGAIIFSDITRGQIDLINKDCGPQPQ